MKISSIRRKKFFSCLESVKYRIPYLKLDGLSPVMDTDACETGRQSEIERERALGWPESRYRVVRRGGGYKHSSIYRRVYLRGNWHGISGFSGPSTAKFREMSPGVKSATDANKRP